MYVRHLSRPVPMSLRYDVFYGYVAVSCMHGTSLGLYLYVSKVMYDIFYTATRMWWCPACTSCTVRTSLVNGNMLKYFFFCTVVVFTTTVVVFFETTASS